MKLSGIFFWRKKSEAAKAEQMLQLFIKYLPQIRKAQEQALKETTDGSIIGQMYDFYEDAMDGSVPEIRPWNGNETTPSDSRKEAKPVDVLAELEHVPTQDLCKDIDEKIRLFKTKSRIAGQRFAKAQIDGFIKRLENRRWYGPHAAFFGAFPNTTDDKIDALLEKYKLEMNKSDLFVPTFPKEAVDVMDKYAEMTSKITKEAPVFYVIAEVKDFKAKRKKLDPILLVQSPFGFYWQILGAWDKEMLLLHEL